MKTEDGKLMQLSAIPVSQSQIYPASVNVHSSAQTVVIKTEPSLNHLDRNFAAKSASSRLSLAKMVDTIQILLDCSCILPNIKFLVKTMSDRSFMGTKIYR